MSRMFESLLLSETKSEREENKYHILTHVYESRKTVLVGLFAGQQWRWTQRKTCGHSWEEETGQIERMAWEAAQ